MIVTIEPGHSMANKAAYVVREMSDPSHTRKSEGITFPTKGIIAARGMILFMSEASAVCPV